MARVLRRDGFFDLLRVDVQRPGVDVDKDRMARS